MNAFDQIETVTTPLTVFAQCLASLEATSSKNEKQAIVAATFKSNPNFEAQIASMFNLALSPYYTFGVKQIPEPALPGVFDKSTAYEGAMKLLFDLSKRAVTGGEAKIRIANVLGNLEDDAEREAFRRILLKDLKAGVDSTINKARKGTVEVFSCQLADSEMPDIEKLTYPIAVEAKYDGVRTIAIKINGVVNLYSRNGLTFDNFAEIEEFLTANMPDNFVLDGEVLHSTELGQEGYSKLMKRAKASRGKNVDGNPVRYQVFDCMDLASWTAQKTNLTYRQRRTILMDVVHKMGEVHGKFGIAPANVVSTPDELGEVYRNILALGYEGVIIKIDNGGYTFKRNSTWMKLKPFDAADLKITGFVEGTGKYGGSLGAITCAGMHDSKDIETEVGSGFTDAERSEIWHNRAQYLGKMVEVKFQDITKAQDAEKFSLRFPTFVRFRVVDAAGKA